MPCQRRGTFVVRFRHNTTRQQQTNGDDNAMQWQGVNTNGYEGSPPPTKTMAHHHPQHRRRGPRPSTTPRMPTTAQHHPTNDDNGPHHPNVDDNGPLPAPPHQRRTRPSTTPRTSTHERRQWPLSAPTHPLRTRNTAHHDPLPTANMAHHDPIPTANKTHHLFEADTTNFSNGWPRQIYVNKISKMRTFGGFWPVLLSYG